MTGRDLIIYILQNDLLDAPVYEHGRLLGFMTATEAAAKFQVGLATIYAWAKMNFIPSAMIGEDLYIYVNATNPMSNT